MTEDGQGLELEGPYRLIIDGIGGKLFKSLVKGIAKGGTLVSYGVSGSAEVTLSLYPEFFGGGGQRKLYGLMLHGEAEIESSSIALGRLLRLVEHGQLTPPAITEADWLETPKLAENLLARKFSGKAVLTIGQ